MIKLSKPEQKITENGITYLQRTPEQVEEDLLRMIKKYGKENDESFIKHWKTLLSAKVPVCPKCKEIGGPIRKTVEGKIIGCDKCLAIASYIEEESRYDLVGLREAAGILGWDPRRVATYRSRGIFPKPVAELAAGPVWARWQIEEFKAAKAAK